MDTATISTAQAGLSLEEQIARLQALLEASRQVHSTIAVKDVLHETARILVRELEMDGAVLLGPDVDEVVASYGEEIQQPYRDCARFPLRAKDGSRLAELIVRKNANCVLTLYEQDFIDGLVLQAAVALENATFHERDVQWARVQQDLDAARNIQRSLLPKSMPQVPGYSIAARNVTCYEVGGDYLDTMVLPDGSHLLVVADVAGKGLASAIVATSFRAAFRSLAGQSMPLEELVSRVGELHWQEGTESRRRYVTAIFAKLDSQNCRIEVVNAGHNPGVLVHPAGATHLIEASGTPLGMLPGMSYSLDTFDFPAGSRLLLYTDGLTEVFCGEEEFGCERLSEAFQSLESEDAEQMLKSLWNSIEDFSDDGPQSDDMTAVVLSHLARSDGKATHV